MNVPSIGIFIFFYIRRKAVNHSSSCKADTDGRVLGMSVMKPDTE